MQITKIHPNTFYGKKTLKEFKNAKEFNTWFKTMNPLLDDSSITLSDGIRKHEYRHDKNKTRTKIVTPPHNLSTEMRTSIQETEEAFSILKKYFKNSSAYLTNKILAEPQETSRVKNMSHNGILVIENNNDFEIYKTAENALKIIIRDSSSKEIKRNYFIHNDRLVENYTPGKPAPRPEQYTYLTKEFIKKIEPQIQEDLSLIKKTLAETYKRLNDPAVLKNLNKLK